MSNAESIRRSSRKRKPSSKAKDDKTSQDDQDSQGSSSTVASRSPSIPSPPSLPGQQARRHASVAKSTNSTKSRSRTATPSARSSAKQPTAKRSWSPIGLLSVTSSATPSAPSPPTPTGTLVAKKHTQPSKSIRLTLKRAHSPSSASDSTPAPEESIDITRLGRPPGPKRRRVIPKPTRGSLRTAGQGLNLPEQLERAFAANLKSTDATVYDNEIPPLDLTSDAATRDLTSALITPALGTPALGTPAATSPIRRTSIAPPTDNATPPIAAETWHISMLDLPLAQDHLSLRPSNAQRSFLLKKISYRGFYPIPNSTFLNPEPDLPRFLCGETVDLGPKNKLPSPGKRKRATEVQQPMLDDDYLPALGRRKQKRKAMKSAEDAIKGNETGDGESSGGLNGEGGL